MRLTLIFKTSKSRLSKVDNFTFRWNADGAAEENVSKANVYSLACG